MASIKVTLSKPIIGHEGPITEIEVREPTYRDFQDLGEPFLVGTSDAGQPFVMENPQVIAEYMDRCVVGVAPALLKQASARTARQIKEAVLRFFGADAPETEASKT